MFERVEVGGVDEDAGAWRHELGRAADPRCDDRTGARHRLEHRLPEGFDEARLADDVRARQPARNLVVRDAPHDADAVAPLELRAQGTVADERQAALGEAREGVSEPDDVLPLRERADAEEGGRGELPAGRL